MALFSPAQSVSTFAKQKQQKKKRKKQKRNEKKKNKIGVAKREVNEPDHDE